jgi:hypothetical protein
MVKIELSDETATFLSQLAHTMKTQDNRGTADPYFFTVRKLIDVGVPDDCGDETRYFDNHDVESYTEEQARKNAEELEMDFDEYVEKRCHAYQVQEEERFENFFFTMDGYNQHVKMNGHNIARECNRYDSYVQYAFRNPELEKVIAAIKEIGSAVNTAVCG